MEVQGMEAIDSHGAHTFQSMNESLRVKDLNGKASPGESSVLSIFIFFWSMPTADAEVPPTGLRLAL